MIDFRNPESDPPSFILFCPTCETRFNCPVEITVRLSFPKEPQKWKRIENFAQEHDHPEEIECPELWEHMDKRLERRSKFIFNKLQENPKLPLETLRTLVKNYEQDLEDLRQNPPTQ